MNLEVLISFAILNHEIIDKPNYLFLIMGIVVLRTIEKTISDFKVCPWGHHQPLIVLNVNSLFFGYDRLCQTCLDRAWRLVQSLDDLILNVSLLLSTYFMPMGFRITVNLYLLLCFFKILFFCTWWAVSAPTIGNPVNVNMNLIRGFTWVDTR